MKVFISRNIALNGPLYEYAKKNNISIHDEPLITFTQVRYTYTPQTNWIFFTSKNAIKYFFAQEPNLPIDVKFGVLSDVSSAYLNEFGKKADFIGEGVDLFNISKEFKKVLKNDSVLFPQAIDSYQTIQKQLSFTNTCYNLFVYKTILRTNVELPYFDVLIFTSPSNVEAYLQNNKINPSQLIIAMGASTRSCVKEKGAFEVLTPLYFNEEGLLKVLISYLNNKITIQ